MDCINKLEFLPLCLKRLKNPPNDLFFRGNLELLNYPKVAIVGSRKCTKYTQNLILTLANILKKHDIVVVSGGAIGADMYAHQGSLPLSIGVFANSLDIMYPIQNKHIIQELYTNSLALSEHEKNYTARSYDFLQRNRIVVGLCDAVVIAQADIKSGSMSSANHAIASSIPLFGFAQKMNDSDGTNLLISKGKMQLLYDFDEFAKSLCKNFIQKQNENLPELQDEILEFIQRDNDFNNIYAKFGTKLFEYELEGKIIIDGMFVRLV